MSPAWQALTQIYLIGLFIAAPVTFLLSHDPSLRIRLLTAKIIGLTWPMSLPVVLLFALF
ncbi:GhoT/OrtT family toxin [Candidatus Sodalis sp. SoCistrobi]|uniref:GhoT/OrtT family toxin n=1 Tax=Candidatus Sodalis sp. SoCistrobi TaxID=1922216 RepID=UPI00093DF992|nr:GhoT/OrtT family toxin [Candidatus Sodalis sp. SoCistrobi]